MQGVLCQISKGNTHFAMQTHNFLRELRPSTANSLSIQHTPAAVWLVLSLPERSDQNSLTSQLLLTLASVAIDFSAGRAGSMTDTCARPQDRRQQVGWWHGSFCAPLGLTLPFANARPAVGSSHELAGSISGFVRPARPFARNWQESHF